MNQKLCDAKQKISALRGQIGAVTDLEIAITTSPLEFDVDIVENGIEFDFLLAYLSRRKSKLLAAVAGEEQKMKEAAK